MEVGLVVLGLYAVVATVMLFVRKPAAPALPASSSSSSSSSSKPSSASAAASPRASDDVVGALEKKLAEAKADAQGAREKLASKQKEVDELREQAKAKARREGKKETRETDDSANKGKGPDPRDVEIQSLRKGMAGLESQLNSIKREAAAKDASSSEASNKTAAEIEGARKSAEGEREKRRALEDELVALKKTIDELRGALKKADARPDVPGTTLNLKELPTPAVQELSRFFRKGEEFERLYTVSQSQLQLEKDRYLELQRRYFAVCRELAVQAGLPANTPESELQKRAEAVVEGAAEKLAERQARLASGGAAPTTEAAAAEGQAAAAADGKKKRRRRRRRKIAGEPSVVDGAAGADDGDDGDDDEGGDDGDVAAAAGDGKVDGKGNGGDSGASAPA
jgi:myosin heavy subunit